MRLLLVPLLAMLAGCWRGKPAACLEDKNGPCEYNSIHMVVEVSGGDSRRFESWTTPPWVRDVDDEALSLSGFCSEYSEKSGTSVSLWFDVEFQVEIADADDDQGEFEAAFELDQDEEAWGLVFYSVSEGDEGEADGTYQGGAYPGADHQERRVLLDSSCRVEASYVDGSSDGGQLDCVGLAPFEVDGAGRLLRLDGATVDVVATWGQ